MSARQWSAPGDPPALRSADAPTAGGSGPRRRGQRRAGRHTAPLWDGAAERPEDARGSVAALTRTDLPRQRQPDRTAPAAAHALPSLTGPAGERLGRAARRAARDGGRHVGRRRAPAEITVRALRDAVVPGPRRQEDRATLPGWGTPGRTTVGRRAAARVRDVARGVRPAFIPTKNGSHRASGRLGGLAAYRQPALLLALVAIAVLLVADPPELRADPQQTAAQQQAAQQEADARNQATGPQRRGGPAGGVPRGGPDTAKPDPAAPSKPAPAAPPAGSPPAPTAPSASVTPTGAPPSPTRPVIGPARSVRLTGSDTVALTFDDGPDAVQTPRLLDLLAKTGVKATFCVVGKRAQAHPDLIRRIAGDGHTLCNHSWDHDFQLGKRKAEEITVDLERTNQAIRAARPEVRIPYFRAPGGNFTTELVRVAAGEGMTSIHWEVDPRDWERSAEESDATHIARIVEQVRRETRKGSIVLSHDFAQPQTITAYGALLPFLKERFDLVALP